MPFTYLPHQAPVLPLKRWRPRLFAGTALVAGSIAPDVEYFLRGRPLATFGHTAWGQLWWTVPVGLVLTWMLARLIIPTIAPLLPDGGPFHLRAWRFAGARASGARYWLVAAPSVYVGGWTHLAWDWFTHDYGYGAKRYPVLLEPVGVVLGRPVPLYAVLWAISTVLGAAATLWMLAGMGREGLPERWSGAVAGEPAPSPRERAATLRGLATSIVAALAVSVWLAERAAPAWSQDWWMAVAMRMLILPVVGAAIVGAVLRRRPVSSPER
jgi:hypothetical protein